MGRQRTNLAGRYTLLEMLSKGGQAEVWLARHDALDRMVAIKLVSSAGRETFVTQERFTREARACAQLQSPHIVQIFDYGIEGKEAFLVMELLKGRDLGTLRAARGPWPAHEVLPIVEQTCRGLAVAHAAGVVHRDIKPPNLFLAEVGDQTILKIVDFGIAQITESRTTKLTRPGLILGSPNYMSPEQIIGEGIDHRTDLWSLAVVAYGLLAGRLPFVAEAGAVVAEKILVGDRPKLGELSPDLEAFDPFFDRALALDSHDRFGSTDEMLKAFTALVAPPPAGSSKDDEPTDVVGLSISLPPGADPDLTWVPEQPPTHDDTTTTQALARTAQPVPAAPLPPPIAPHPTFANSVPTYRPPPPKSRAPVYFAVGGAVLVAGSALVVGLAWSRTDASTERSGAQSQAPPAAPTDEAAARDEVSAAVDPAPTPSVEPAIPPDVAPEPTESPSARPAPPARSPPSQPSSKKPRMDEPVYLP